MNEKQWKFAKKTNCSVSFANAIPGARTVKNSRSKYREIGCHDSRYSNKTRNCQPSFLRQLLHREFWGLFSKPSIVRDLGSAQVEKFRTSHNRYDAEPLQWLELLVPLYLTSCWTIQLNQTKREKNRNMHHKIYNQNLFFLIWLFIYTHISFRIQNVFIYIKCSMKLT